MKEQDRQAALDALERILSYTNGLGDGEAYTIRATLTAKQELVNTISNLTILMFLMGYQGGTIHQCAEYLQTTTYDILNANKERMECLMRVAQLIGAKRYTADMTDALKYAHSQMQPFCDDTIVRKAIARAEAQKVEED